MVSDTPVKKFTKAGLAASLGVSRSSLYYVPKRPLLDNELKLQIQAVLVDNPSYGHKRIAIELKMGKNRIRRVMKKFGIKPYRRRARLPRKPEDQNKPVAKYQNKIKLLCPIRPTVVWVSDFTYIRYEDQFIYLATIMDLFTREIIGWNISRFHNKELILGALADASVRERKAPLFLHSDQGSEYEALEYLAACEVNRIEISMSAKSSPWENANQESFYSTFKVDLGRTDRFESLGELVEAIHLAIYYYNEKRIHTSLKMSPIKFRERYQLKQNQLTKSEESVSKKPGT